MDIIQKYFFVANLIADHHNCRLISIDLVNHIIEIRGSCGKELEVFFNKYFAKGGIKWRISTTDALCVNTL